MDDAELDTLLAPLAGDAPCGPSLLHDAVFDAIREARREDDASLPQGVWTAPLKKPDWPAVSRLCTQVLATRSKDVQVAAWLGEAWIAQHGTAGGLRATRLLQGMCERYWEHLHPLPRGGDVEFRTMPMEWADANWAAALHGRVVLVGGRDGDGHTLRAWQAALAADNDARKQDNAPAQADAASMLIIDSAAALPAAALRQTLAEIDGWNNAMDPLQTVLRQHLENDAPRFWQLRRTLQSAGDMVGRCLRAHPQAQATDGPASAQAPVSAPSADVSMACIPTAAAFSSRDDAYRMLDAAAHYLSSIEPHSPVPALLKRAVGWGRMSFDELLDELMKNDGEMQRMLYRINQ